MTYGNHEGNCAAMLALCHRRGGRWQSVGSFAAALDIPRQTLQHYLRGDRGNLGQVAYRYQYDHRVRQTWATCAGTSCYQLSAIHRGWASDDLFANQQPVADNGAEGIIY